jgi:hypothetical protein
MNPNTICEIIANETNVKRVTFPTRTIGDGKPIELVWTEEDGLDVFLGGIPQYKPDLAVLLFREIVWPNINRECGSK